MKKFFFIPLLLACLAWTSESIRVEVKDEQPNNNGMLGLRMRIVNNSGQSFNGVQVRYCLKKQSNYNLVLDNYYMSGLSANLEQLDSETVVVKVGIPVLGLGQIPDANGISLGLYRSDWGSVHKNDLPGYPGPEFAEAETYGVYLGDSLIAGTILSTESLDDHLKLRFVGVRPETADSSSPWVQLQNYGDLPISLNGVKIKDASGNSHSLGSLTIGAKSTLRVCRGPVSSCAIDSFMTSISTLSFGKIGEFVLYQDSIPLDYIVWGARGAFADSLEVENSEINPENFFNTSEESIVGPISRYCKGDFFRAVIKNGSDSIVSWNKFRKNMVGLSFSQWPYAEALSLGDSSAVFKRNGEESVLAWIPAVGAKSYEVTILNADNSNVAYHGYTRRPKVSVPLGAGEYVWWVIPMGEDVPPSNPDYFIPWESEIPSEFQGKYKVFVLPESAKPIRDLEVDPLAARKDSYMLDLKWGEHIIDAEWDKPHNSSGYIDGYGNRRFSDPKHFHYDVEEGWRCWAVAVAELNHYYGGNLTQDEIKYYIKSRETGDNILGAFPHHFDGTGFPEDVLRWALNIENVQEPMGWTFLPGDDGTRFVFTGMRLTDEEFKAALAAKYPIIVWHASHIMLIDAVIKVDGTPYGRDGEIYVYRYHNIDNDGTVSWMPIEYPFIQQFYIVKDPRKFGISVRMSELYIDKNNNGVMEEDFDEIFDADGDGLLDFDEYYRFGTYQENLDYDANGNEKLDFEEYRLFAAEQQELNRDYDNDKIWDKTEIMSYTIREKYPEPTVDGDRGVSVEFFADIDGDGLRAEKDPDSDDDTMEDGEEDINHDGIKDENETDVYYKDNNQIIPSGALNITLYALSELNYNDGVVCFNENTPSGFCSVVSAAQGVIGDYAAKLGARSTVGDVYSRGNVLLRSNTHVKGGIYLAGGSGIGDIYLQNGSVIDGGITNWTLTDWDEYILLQDYDLDDYSSPSNAELIVHNGEAKSLGSGSYSFVKVEAGGTLYIQPGTIYIGSIQLDSRSNVAFMKPGHKTEMHINGRFSWRAKTLNDASQYEDIARGFQLVQHANGNMYIDNVVAGSIVAPYSHVIIAQSKKVFYGKVFAEKISVHQYAKIYHVDFDPVLGELVVGMVGI